MFSLQNFRFSDYSDDLKVDLEQMWEDRGNLERWIEMLFEEVKKSSPTGEMCELKVGPFSISYDKSNLFALDLLSVTSTRPATSAVKSADFPDLFCSQFLNFCLYHSTELPQQLDTQKFPFWMCKKILEFAELPENKFLDFVTPENLSKHLEQTAKHDVDLMGSGMSHHVNFVGLYVSVFLLSTEEVCGGT